MENVMIIRNHYKHKNLFVIRSNRYQNHTQITFTFYELNLRTSFFLSCRITILTMLGVGTCFIMLSRIEILKQIFFNNYHTLIELYDL